MDSVIILKDMIVMIITAIYDMIAFILFFLDLYSFTNSFKSFTILYFMVVTLGTMGFGDVTFKS